MRSVSDWEQAVLFKIAKCFNQTSRYFERKMDHLGISVGKYITNY